MTPSLPPLPHIEIAIGPHRLLLSTEGVREIWERASDAADFGAGPDAHAVWRGVRVSLLDGRAMFGLPPADTDDRAHIAHQHGGTTLILAVDAVLGLRRIMPGDLLPLPPLPRSTTALVDAAWLGQDGHLRLRLRNDRLEPEDNGAAPEKELLNAR